MKIGPYETSKELGRGVHGVTYLAVHEESGRRVALKWLHGELSEATEAGRPEFDARARVLAGLQHPAVVDILAVGWSARMAVVVSELVDGLDLRALRERGERLTPDQILSLTKQAAIALEYAHSYEVIHGNVCPRNILWTLSGAVKVCDFGMASLAELLTGGGRVAASSPYTAPEVVAGAQPLSVRSDLYGLGAVVYELLTGNVPYGGTGGAAQGGRFQFLELTGSAPPVARTQELVPPRQINPACPAALEAALLAVLQEDPYRRPASVDDFQEFLLGRRTFAPGVAVARPPKRVPVEPAKPALDRPLNLCPGCKWPLHPASRVCLACGGGLSIASTATEPHERLGDRLVGQAKWADAQQAYSAAAQSGKASADVWVGLARAQAGARQYADARQTYKRLVASRPMDELLQLELAQVLLALRQTAEARRLLEPLAERAEQPEVAASARMLLAALDVRDGNYVGAVRRYKRVIMDDPRVALAHCGLGECLEAVHDTEGAVAEFEAALRIEPGLKRASDGMARALDLDRHRLASDPLASVLQGLSLGRGGGLLWLLQKLGDGRRRGW
jgi:Tfp pilus assembly protein PilF